MIRLGLPPRAAAEVSDEDFNALKDAVRQLSDKVQKLEQTHEEDQKVHEQDQQKIQQLQQQVGETQKAATEAQQEAGTAAQMKRKINQLEEQVGETKKAAIEAEGKAQATAQVQPVAPVPSGALATHNVTLVGDAEVQFGKVRASTARLRWPISRRSSCIGQATTSCSKRVSTSGCRMARSRWRAAKPATAARRPRSILVSPRWTILHRDDVTVVAGNMLLPLGTYSERSAGWLNKIPDDPLPRAVLPGTGIGAQLRGSIPIGRSGQQLTYAAYVSNGAGSVDGSGHANFVDSSGNVLPNLDFGNVGIQSNGNTGNEHSSVGGGGRLGRFR